MRRRKSRRFLRIFNPPPKKYFILNFVNLVEFFLIFLLSGLLLLIFRSDFFEVAFIDCQKEGFLCSDEEISLFTDALGKNIFFVNKDELASSVKSKNIKLMEVQINKKLPNRLIVKLKIRKPLAILSVGEAKFLVDESGFVFSPLDRQNSSLPIVLIENHPGVSLGTEVEKKIKKALELIKVLNSFFLPCSKLAVQQESLTLYSPQLIATFSASKDFFVQGGSLQLLMRSSKISQSGKITKIDLRFDKPVVIFK